MNKVLIIGCPGSGKSTFGRKLRDITDLPLYHLDMLYWNEDKTTVLKETFIERLKTVMDKPQWIIDGNYESSMEMRIKECDTVFFLDFSVEVCLNGIKERKGKVRSDMPWIETGTDEEFIEFIKNYNLKNRPQVMKLLERYCTKNIKIFSSREDADNYLSILLKGEKDGCNFY